MTLAIETHSLSKSFGDTHALRDLDLSIRRGSVYGLLGPNGAGKTTTIRLLATLLRPTKGRATVLGLDVVEDAREVRKKVSLTGQYASVDEDLTGTENLVLIGRLFGLPWRDARERAAELLDAFGLAEAGKRLARTYSGGMRRRLDVAASLVVTPEIVFLDEPTTGLDPRSRNQVWDIVRTIAAQGSTVLLTTQYMEEADRLADRLAVIDQGRLIAEGTGGDLKASVGANALRLRFQSQDERVEAGRRLQDALGLELRPGSDAYSLVAAITDDAQVPEAYRLLSGNGLRLAEFAIGQPSMDEVFFALTGHAAEPASGDAATEATA